MEKLLIGFIFLGSMSSFAATTINSLEQEYLNHLNEANVISPNTTGEGFQEKLRNIRESRLTKREYALLRLEICQSVTPDCSTNIEFSLQSEASEKEISTAINLGTIKRNMPQEEKDRLLYEQQAQQQGWN